VPGDCPEVSVAAGNIGAEIVAKATPDGHTILMANSTIAIPALFSRLPFDIRKDFVPVSLIAIGPSVLVAHPSLAVKDVKGLVAFAKANPKRLSYGSGGLGNVTHLAMELFASLAAIDMVHVPYKGGAPSLVALLGGEVQLLFSSIPGALPHITAGRIKALGVSISKRSGVLPDVPTIDKPGCRATMRRRGTAFFCRAAFPRVLSRCWRRKSARSCALRTSGNEC
jgi:tripartite-type tricarboxylate transporter receptor subunit TctC